MFDADYWVANVRNPVRFSQAVAAAAENHATFIEVSPHPLLTHAITDSLESVKPRGDVHAMPERCNRDDHETLTFHTQLASVRPPLNGTAQSASQRRSDSRTSHRRRGCIRGTGWRIGRLGGG